MKRSASQFPITDRLTALSEMSRLRICRLLEREELSVGEIAQVIQAPQSTVSRHLKLLLDGGWLARRADGTATLYRLVLDDLPTDARALWLTVRGQIGETAELQDDLRRLGAVLADRRLDSQAFFGRVAGAWDELRNELFGSGFTASALLGLLPGDWVVADLGCGTGNASELLAPLVKKVVAIDQSPTMLAAARKRLGAHRNVEFLEGSIDALPVQDGSLDAAVFVLVLHHLDEPVGALREVRRSLRPGGVALAVDMLSHDRSEYRHAMGHKHLGFEPDEVRSMFREAGFGPARVREMPGVGEARGPSLFAAAANRPID